MRPLRWFYVPNEVVEGDQVGPRKAFGLLHGEGLLSAYAAYSYLVERTKAASHAQALEGLHAAVDAFQPDVIYFQHLNGSYPVDSAYVRRLKSVASRPRFVWHDPDPYGRFVKPIDATMKAALAETDMAVVVGLGYLAEHVRRAGAKRVLFAPHSYDDERFGQSWEPTPTRPYDAIMIANLTCLKRMPFLFMPGGRNRKVMSRAFHAAYGERYAVFGAGQGWKGEPYCRGPIPFDAQERTIRSSWLTINWGQFDEIAMYSSDRLPISLAAGVPHITNHQRGYEHLFPDARGIYFVHSPAEALDVADFLLSKPREELAAIGAAGVAYARERLNATRVYRDVVTAIREQLFAGGGPAHSHAAESAGSPA
jgi:hypothetical protein